jgi:hypothetical protein
VTFEALLQRLQLLEGALAAMQLQADKLREENAELRKENVLLKHQLEVMNTHRFGDRSEKRKASGLTMTSTAPDDDTEPTPPEPGSGGAANDTSASNEHNEPTSGGPKKNNKKKKGTKLQLDPARTTVKTTHLYPECNECGCCHAQLREAASETTRWVQREPVRYTLHEEIRHTYVCSKCHGPKPVTAPKEYESPLGAGPVGVTLGVDIAIFHTADHLPFYRITTLLGREGLGIARSTVCRAFERVASMLRPLYIALTQHQETETTVMGMDFTHVREWSLNRCKRRAILFRQTRDTVVLAPLKTADAAMTWDGIERYRGPIITDAGSVFVGNYPKLVLSQRVALCNAHSRRPFIECENTDTIRSSIAIAFYARVAREERRWRKHSAADRLLKRQEILKPLCTMYDAWVDQELLLVPEHMPIYQALAYEQRHRAGLRMFLENGEIPWTNNETELVIRKVVIGRKGWLFRGSFRGLENYCVVSSIVLTCTRLGINPRTYLLELLEALATISHAELKNWLPHAYAERMRLAAPVDQLAMSA